MKKPLTKDLCIEKYKEYKNLNNKIPLSKDYITFSGISIAQLTRIFGENAYSEMQKECGDVPNKIKMERAPLEKIMRQYGDLIMEIKKLPSTALWIHRNYSPQIRGLARAPHFIDWKEFPQKFKNWIEENNVKGYEEALSIINSDSKYTVKQEKNDSEFEKIVREVQMWSPARGRNTEETYKVELRKHLEQLKYYVQEEFGQSNCDLLVNKEYFIEMKKSPNLSEYDRLFGQLARHLQGKSKVIALIMDVSKGDNYENFCLLVDKYFNKEENFVRVLNK